MEYFLIGIVWCIVWGVVVNKVIENKGYQENWFWWGFFFGIFALIVAVTKQNIPQSDAPTTAEQLTKADASPEMQIAEVRFDKIDINSAVHITEWNVCKDNNAVCTLSIDFFNLSSKTIAATLFTATGLNSFGDPILIDGKEYFEILSQDICVEPGKHCHVKASLPNQDIRKVQLAVNKVCFSDGEIVQAQPNRWIETRQQAIDQIYADCIRRKNPQGAYHAIIEDKYWQCTCGFVNVGHTCLVCGMSKLDAGEFTAERIEEAYQRYLNVVDEERKAEDERRRAAAQKAVDDAIAAKKQKKKLRRQSFLFICAILAVVVAAVGVSHIIKDKEYQQEADQIDGLIAEEEYDAAYSVMISSRSYKKLANTYGELLWAKQIEMDEAFLPVAFPYDRINDAVYEPEHARGGVYIFHQSGEKMGIAMKASI